MNITKSYFDEPKKYYPPPMPDPDPGNYKILRFREYRDCLILELQYLDCTNYEGRKVLVFKDCSMKDIIKQRHIDPHFSESKKFKSPVARFEPTDSGWVWAFKFLTNI